MSKFVLPGMCLAIGVIACGVSESATKPSSGVSMSTKVVQSANVTSLYSDNCSNCHGVNGEGGGAGTKSFNTKEKFDQSYDRPFFDAIKQGVPDMGMAAFGQSFSEPQIWALVVHIRELQRNALRAEFGSPKSVAGVFTSQRARFRIETVVESGLSTPWSLDWLPNGDMLVTNRPGGLFVYRGGAKIAAVEGVPPSIEQGQGGLMEVRVHRPSGWVYLSLADPAKEGNGAMTKIVRGKIVVSGATARWTQGETIYEAEQAYYSRAGVHFGSKIVFDDAGHVFFSVGERGTNIRVQKENESPYGKIMRLNLDGSVPSDNPIPGNPMWSTGHRNPQGLTIDLEGGLWDSEHGPRGGDEINLIQKGANYGWPVRALSINYNDTPFVTPWNEAGEKYAYPVFRWLPSVGASGLDVVKGGAFTAWHGDLLGGGLAGNNLDRFRMKDGVLVEHEELIHGMGRIREINVHDDGTVYLAINGPDKIVRLVPAE